MNTQQANAIAGHVSGATGDIAMNTKNSQSLADGFKPGRLALFLSSIVPSLRSFGASFVDKVSDKARDKDGGAPSTAHCSLFTLRLRSGRAVYCSLFTGFLLAAFAPRAEAGVAATGGTMSSVLQNGTNYVVHTFTTPGTSSLNFTAGGNVEVLVVAGGGGGGSGEPSPGGDGAGGGGAGGYVYSNSVTVVSGSNYTVIVGAGGSGATTNSSKGTNGSDSVFGAITAIGGGGGGSDNHDITGINQGANGGSGGGAASYATGGAGESATTGGVAQAGQGNNGGGSNKGLSSRGGGGGGGANAAGITATNNTGAAGGAGTNFSISGSTVTYAGGGGGGGGSSAGSGSGGGAGGSGGGGAGGTSGNNPLYNGTNATANTGGGGGGGGGGLTGSSGNGGNGGSGIVIVRYVVTPTPSQMKITFGGYTGKSEVLTNFPVLVVFSNNVGGSSGFNYNNFLSSSGYDLRFATNSTRTADSLNYEIESWNTNGASYIWVQVPTIPIDGSGAIWANWGNTAASTQLACTTNGTVWDTNFKVVYHLKETGTNPQVKDSTAYGYNSSAQVWTPSTGQIGGGGSFTKVSPQSYIDISTNPITTNFTISGWVKSTDTAVLFDSRYSDSSGVVLYTYLANKKANFYTYGPDAPPLESTATNLTDGNWHYVAASYNGKTAKVYADSSAPVSSNRTYANISTSAKASISKVGFVPEYYTGSYDELRVSTVIRSDNWLWAEYLNAASNTVFNNYGKMEAIIPAPKGTVIMFR